MIYFGYDDFLDLVFFGVGGFVGPGVEKFAFLVEFEGYVVFFFFAFEHYFLTVFYVFVGVEGGVVVYLIH